MHLNNSLFQFSNKKKAPLVFVNSENQCFSFQTGKINEIISIECHIPVQNDSIKSFSRLCYRQTLTNMTFVEIVVVVLHRPANLLMLDAKAEFKVNLRYLD